MGRHLAKGLPSLLMLLESEKGKGGVQQPEINCWIRGSTRKKPGLPRGHTAAEAATERVRRKTLGARSPPGSLVEGGAQFLPTHRQVCCEPWEPRL